MSEQEAPQTTLIEPGNYRGKLKETHFGASSKGTPQWTLTFEIAPGTNRVVYLYCSDAAIENTIKTLQGLGVTSKSGDVDDLQFPDTLYQDGVELYCKHEEYEGKTREKWNISQFVAAPASPDQRQAFKTAWKSLGGGAPAPAARKPDPKPAPSNAAPPQRNKTATPPPRRNATPPGQVDVVAKSYDEAWKYAQEANADLTDTVFYQCIDEQEKRGGHKEANFTADDWNQVARWAAMPSEAPF